MDKVMTHRVLQILDAYADGIARGAGKATGWVLVIFGAIALLRHLAY